MDKAASQRLASPALQILHDKAVASAKVYDLPRKSDLPAAWKRFHAFLRPAIPDARVTHERAAAHDLARSSALRHRTIWAEECRATLKTSAWSDPKDWLKPAGRGDRDGARAVRFLQQLRTGDHLTLENGAWQDGAAALAKRALAFETEAAEVLGQTGADGLAENYHDVARGLFNGAMRSPRLLAVSNLRGRGSELRLDPRQRVELYDKFKQALFEKHRSLNLEARQAQRLGALQGEAWRQPGWWVMTPSRAQIAQVLNEVLNGEFPGLAAPQAPGTPPQDSKHRQAAVSPTPSASRAAGTPSATAAASPVLDRDAVRWLGLRHPPVFGGLVQNASEATKKKAISDWLTDIQRTTFERYGVQDAADLFKRLPAVSAGPSGTRSGALALLTQEPGQVTSSDLPRLKLQFAGLVEQLKLIEAEMDADEPPADQEFQTLPAPVAGDAAADDSDVVEA